MTFNESDVAIIDGQKWCCIISNNSIAVLGKLEEIKGSDGLYTHSVKYEGCAVYSNTDGHREFIKGLEWIGDMFGIEKTEFAPDIAYAPLQEYQPNQ